MEKNFVKVQSSKDIILSISLIILGVALAVLPLGGAVNVTGICVAITGLILIFLLKNGYKDSSTGERYAKKELYYHISMKNELIAHVTQKPEAIEAGTDESNNALRLVIYYSEKSGKAYLQLFEYVPYKYEARTDMMEYDLAQVHKLIK